MILRLAGYRLSVAIRRDKPTTIREGVFADWFEPILMACEWAFERSGPGRWHKFYERLEDFGYRIVPMSEET